MDQYCILGRIGEGAHGIVFKAKHVEVRPRRRRCPRGAPPAFPLPHAGLSTELGDHVPPGDGSALPSLGADLCGGFLPAPTVQKLFSPSCTDWGDRCPKEGGPAAAGGWHS